MDILMEEGDVYGFMGGIYGIICGIWRCGYMYNGFGYIIKY